MNGDIIKIKAAIDDSELQQLKNIDGLYGYAVKQSRSGEDVDLDVVNNLIKTQNIASQAHGYSGVQKAIDAYNKSLSVNSDKTTAATDDTKKFIDILSTNNTKLADCMKNANGCSIKISDYAVSLGKSAIKTVALTAATAALNTAMSFGISAIITGLTTAIDNFIHREERLTEAAKNASENITNIKSSFDNLKNSTGDITQEFAELSQHVDQITGKNIDLSPENYERFLELSNQLAESLPNSLFIGLQDLNTSIY